MSPNKVLFLWDPGGSDQWEWQRNECGVSCYRLKLYSQYGTSCSCQALYSSAGSNLHHNAKKYVIMSQNLYYVGFTMFTSCYYVQT